jgi:hypothetical protein
MMFPWKLLDFCLTKVHGQVHHHHEPGKLTPCELRKQFKGTAYWPLMDCHEITAKTDNYRVPDKFQIKPSFATPVVTAVLFHIVVIPIPDQPFLSAPDPKCRSATLISVNTRRGPPLTSLPDRRACLSYGQA